jgi:serine/threonine-protein kinase
VFVASETLWAHRFDLDRLEVRGAAVPIVTGLRVDAEGGAVDLTIAENGTLAYVPNSPFNRTFVWVDRQNVETPLEAPPQAYSSPRLSPDGTRVLVTMRDAGQDVFVWDIARRVLQQVTFDEFANNVATWVGNDRIAYSSQMAGGVQLFLKEGTNEARQLTNQQGGLYPFSSSPDGEVLIGTQYPPGGGPADLAIVPIAAPDKRRALDQPPKASENNPFLSPDGRWLAYSSGRAGRVEVYVRPYPDIESGEFLISHDNGRWPAWSNDGTELYYVTTTPAGEMSIHAVAVGPGSPSGWGAPRRLITGRYSLAGGGDRPYDVWRDRFLLMKEHTPEGSAPRHEIVVVLNFLDELRRRVPAD